MSTLREFPPPAALGRLVDALWVRASRADAPPAACDVLPDGCMDLIFRCAAAPGGRVARGGGVLLVSGPDLRARAVALEPGVLLVGARFRPAEARAVLGVDAAPLVGAGVVPVAHASGRLAGLERRLAGCGSAAALVEALAAGVATLAGDAARLGPPPRVREAVALLAVAEPQPRVEEVARALGVAARTLHREVVAWTGLPPKVLARVCRFQAALRRLPGRRGGGGSSSLAALACGAGYADQAHMAREFRALAGVPPSAFA